MHTYLHRRPIIVSCSIFVACITGVLVASQSYAQSEERPLFSPEYTGKNLLIYESHKPNMPEIIGEEPTTTVLYKNTEHSVSARIPYNPIWGTESYRIAQYEDITNGIVFGPIHGYEGGGYARSHMFLFLEPESKEDLMNRLRDRPENTLAPKVEEVSIGNFTTIKVTEYGLCEDTGWYVLDENQNYFISSFCQEENDSMIESIIRSIKPLGDGESSLFPDVETNHANNNAINYAFNQNIISGYPDGTFKPENRINRAEFTKIVVGATRDGEIDGSNCFPDVQDEWFSSFVCTAKENGTIGGYPDGTFRPSDEVNFAEAAKIVVGAFGLEVGDGDNWYEPYIQALGDAGAIPLSIGSLDEKITRGEMAEMVYRLHAEVTDLPSKTFLTKSD
jgi:hypothetical protein